MKAAMLLLVVAMISGNQLSTKAQVAAQDTQGRECWTDPATGLTWTAKDNGKDVSWKKAIKYCRNLRLAGYPDWKLATLSELEAIYDKTANTPGLSMGSDFTWHVRGSLLLTGDQWSSDYIVDDRGKPSGYSWFFDFNEGRKNSDPSGWPYPSSGMRALCVRRPGKLSWIDFGLFRSDDRATGRYSKNSSGAKARVGVRGRFGTTKVVP